MYLTITSPLYYRDIHGIDDEIQWFCHLITKYVANKEYSSIVNSLDLAPIVVPKAFYYSSFYSEHIHYSADYNYASVSRKIDYDKYVSSPIKTKKLLIVKNILDSVYEVSILAPFDFKSFKEDILFATGITEKELEEI